MLSGSFLYFLYARMAQIIRMHRNVSSSHCHPNSRGALSVVSMMSSISGIVMSYWCSFIVRVSDLKRKKFHSEIENLITSDR